MPNVTKKQSGTGKKDEVGQAKNTTPLDTRCVKKETYNTTLVIKYTDKKMAELARKFADMDSRRDAIAQEKQLAMSKFKMELEAQQEAIDGIKERIRKGGTMGTVPCIAHLNKDYRIIKLVRTDTNEEVKDFGHPILNLKDKKEEKKKEGPAKNKKKEEKTSEKK